MNRSSLLVLFCLVFLYSCETLFEADLSATNNSITTLNIRLTDGPIDLEEVNIDLQGVVVKGEAGFEEIPLETNTGIYDLLDFQNGLDTLIARADIQLEQIREVRLILGDNNTVVVDGETHELKIPSGSQSGLKIKACLDLGPMTEFDLLLDFDAGASIHQTGNGKYIMRPVIKLMNAAAQCDDEEEEEEEEEIAFDDLPESIIDTLETSYNGYDFEVQQTILCDETEVYKIKASLDDEVEYLFFDLEGVFLQRAFRVADEELPEEVAIAIGAAYPTYNQVPNSVLLIERADEEIWYQVALQTDQEDFTVIYKADGTFFCDDMMEEEDDEMEEEENILDSLPQGILDYIDENYSGFEFNSSQQTFCDGTEMYILEGKNGPTRILLYFDLDGNFIQVATSFEERDLNDDVESSISADYPAYRIMNNKAWKIEQADGDLWYRVYLKKNNSGEKIYVIYAADGTFICEEG